MFSSLLVCTCFSFVFKLLLPFPHPPVYKSLLPYLCSRFWVKNKLLFQNFNALCIISFSSKQNLIRQNLSEKVELWVWWLNCWTNNFFREAKLNKCWWIHPLCLVWFLCSFFYIKRNLNYRSFFITYSIRSSDFRLILCVAVYRVRYSVTGWHSCGNLSNLLVQALLTLRLFGQTVVWIATLRPLLDRSGGSIFSCSDCIYLYQYPTNSIHIGCFCSLLFMSNISILCQSRKWFVFHEMRQKVKLWNLG